LIFVNRAGYRRYRCRYVARPPLAAGRLTALSEEELLFMLKTPWSETSQDRTLRLYQSITAVRYTNPPFNRMYVISEHQT
jgi:hypothetical protein